MRTALAYLASLLCHGAVLVPLGLLPRAIDTPPGYAISDGKQAIELHASIAMPAQSGGEDVQVLLESAKPLKQAAVEAAEALLAEKDDDALPEIVPPRWRVASDQTPQSTTAASKEQLGEFGAIEVEVAPCKLPTNPDPPYPRDLQTQGIGGVVLLQVHIRADGSVQNVLVRKSSGIASLDESAVSTVRDHWHFEPAMSRGVPIPCECILPIRFKPYDR